MGWLILFLCIIPLVGSFVVMFAIFSINETAKHHKLYEEKRQYYASLRLQSIQGDHKVVCQEEALIGKKIALIAVEEGEKDSRIERITMDSSYITYTTRGFEGEDVDVTHEYWIVTYYYKQ